MALDFGSKRIGVAVADPTETYALPVGTIERTSLHADIEHLKAYVKEYSVGEIVVGDPLTLSGERSFASKQVDEFVGMLERIFPGAIHRIDERMTTAQATKAMISAGLSRKQRRRAVDKTAAALILETFLIKRRHRA